MKIQPLCILISMIVAASNSSAQAPPSPAGPGAAGAPEAQGVSPGELDKGNGPFTDPCGTTVSVEKGSVSLKYKTAKTGPHAGKKCISKITAASDDEVSITVPDGVEIEILVSGRAVVSIIANKQGDKNDTSPQDSEPGILISGDGGFKDGTFQGSVSLSGDGNVLSINGKNHNVTVWGDGNVVFNAGSNSPVITYGNGNWVY